MTTTLDDLATLGPSELGKIIGRATKTIKLDATRRPETLPPRFVVPGTRKLLWRVVDVRAWMDALAQIEADKRMQQRKLARTHGIAMPPVKPFALANKTRGRAASAALAAKTAEAPDEN